MSSVFQSTLGYTAKAHKAGWFDRAESKVRPCVNSTAAVMYPGRAVIRTSTVGSLAQDTKHPVAADFTAKVRTSVVASFSAGQLVTSGVFRGRPFTISTVFASDNDTSVANHVTDLNAYFDAQYTAGQSLLAASTTGTMTITAEIPGEDFTSTTRGDTGTATNTVNSVSVLTDVLYGFSTDSAAILEDSTGTFVESIAVDAAFSSVYDGMVGVTMLAAGAVSQTDDLYISTDSSTSGQVTASAGADRVWIGKSAGSIVRFVDAPATSTTFPRNAVALLNARL